MPLLGFRSFIEIYRRIFEAALSNGRKNETAAEMSFLPRVAGLSIRDRMRSLDICRELGVELPLHRKESVEVV